MTRKYTPEPWTQNIRHGGELTGVDAEVAEIQECEPFALSQIRIPEIGATIIWDSREPGRTERALADGNLLLAAPDLLAALKMAREYMNLSLGSTYEGPNPYPVIDDAIAKALGQP